MSATIGQVCSADHWPPCCAAGVTVADGADAGPVPTALVAVTVNVYAVPSVSPVTVAVVAGGVPVTVLDAWAVLPTYGVTVYEVIAAPPLLGAVQLTTAVPSPALAPIPVGAPGSVGGALVPPRSTTVAISQTVRALLCTAAAGVSPALTALSSASSSMSPAGATVARAVNPPAAVSPSEKPESA